MQYAKEDVCCFWKTILLSKLGIEILAHPQGIWLGKAENKPAKTECLENTGAISPSWNLLMLVLMGMKMQYKIIHPQLESLAGEELNKFGIWLLHALVVWNDLIFLWFYYRYKMGGDCKSFNLIN